MRIGIDTGGTFTDFLLQDDEGNLLLHKVLSTPHAPEEAIMQGISEIGIDTQDLVIIHGSTVATNAILEGKGVETAYITNEGFTDVLTIGRQAREELYNLTPAKKQPLIPAERCIGLKTRCAADGRQLERCDQEDIEALISQLDEIRPRAVAINLLFSYLDDSEERVIEKAIRDRYGDAVFISRSSDVLPEYKEFERGMTTSLNAMVGPLMQKYLRKLEANARGCRLSVMQSSAGTTSVEDAGRYPVHLLLSGPAGGLRGAKAVSDEQFLLTFDMGGTSTDVSIINGEIAFSHESKIGGYPVGVPMIDMHTIGAGGGSIAYVDEGGLLLVGPRSAGADPGPACYGRGGTLPTVTDANVVLGRILPESFLGGHMVLDKEASEKAVSMLADNLGLTIEQAARGIIDIVNDHMVRALRVMSVQRGEDPRDYTLVSFGGAGGLHVCALAEALDMRRAIVPVHAGVLSALGMLVADQSQERSRTINSFVENCDIEQVDDIFSELISLAEKEIKDRSENKEIILMIDVRYKGQSHTLPLDWEGGVDIEERFHLVHEQTYGHRLDIEIEIVNLRARVSCMREKFVFPRWKPSREVPMKQGAVRVFERESLVAGQQIDGPALITEMSSTTWVEKGWRARIDDIGNIILEYIVS